MRQTLQPQDVFDPRAGRTCVPCAQAPVRLHEGALQGDREERRAGVLADRIDQALSGEAKSDGLKGKFRPLRLKTGTRSLKSIEKQG